MKCWKKPEFAMFLVVLRREISRLKSTMLRRHLAMSKNRGPVIQMLVLLLTDTTTSPWMTLDAASQHLDHPMRWYLLCEMPLLVSFHDAISEEQHYGPDFHVSLAHMDAYEAGILHCDISPGNIIIDSDGTGRLIDWDLSKPLAARLETPRIVCTKIPRFVIEANMALIQSSGHTAIHVCWPSCEHD